MWPSRYAISPKRGASMASCWVAPRGAAPRTGSTSTCTDISSSVTSIPRSARTVASPAHFNPVDGHGVPVPHCGVVLEPAQWQVLAARLRQQPVEWVIEPCVRFKGMPGEQSTLFILDPSGNALEFKAFADLTQLFAR